MIIDLLKTTIRDVLGYIQAKKPYNVGFSTHNRRIFHMTEYKDLADSLNKEKDLIPRARRIFNNLSAIESILTRGITVNSLAIVLSNNGFEITFEQLKNGIYQARKKKKKQGGTQENIKSTTAIINKTTAEPPKEEKEEKQAVKRKLTPAEESAEEMKRLKEFKQSKKTGS